MAVVMNRKQLHKHALPIIVLSTGLFIVSIIGLNSLVFSGRPSSDTVGRLLTERLVRVTPASNGLFHVSRYHPADTATSNLSLNSQPTVISGISSTGKVAELEVSMSALAQNTK